MNATDKIVIDYSGPSKFSSQRLGKLNRNIPCHRALQFWSRYSRPGDGMGLSLLAMGTLGRGMGWDYPSLQWVL